MYWHLLESDIQLLMSGTSYESYDNIRDAKGCEILNVNYKLIFEQLGNWQRKRRCLRTVTYYTRYVNYLFIRSFICEFHVCICYVISSDTGAGS